MTPENKLSLKAQTDEWMKPVESRSASLQRLLPDGMKVDWFIAEVRVAVAKVPKLLECDRATVVEAITTCAQLGLSPSGRLGSAYLLPFEDRRNDRVVCTLVVGYRGYLDLAYRSGDVVGFHVQVVHANDHFVAREGFGLEVEHERTEGEPGPLRAVYGVAHMRGGYQVRALMWAREVLTIKASAKGASKSTSPWVTHEAEQWKKTLLRRIVKLLPLSPTKAQFLAQAMETEDAQWEESAVDGEVVEPKSTADVLKAELRQRETPALSAPGPRPTMFAAADRAHATPLERIPDDTGPEPTDEQVKAERQARETKSKGKTT